MPKIVLDDKILGEIGWAQPKTIYQIIVMHSSIDACIVLSV